MQKASLIKQEERGTSRFIAPEERDSHKLNCFTKNVNKYIDVFEKHIIRNCYGIFCVQLYFNCTPFGALCALQNCFNPKI
jgi:hypothetical protein